MVFLLQAFFIDCNVCFSISFTKDAKIKPCFYFSQEAKNQSIFNLMQKLKMLKFMKYVEIIIGLWLMI